MTQKKPLVPLEHQKKHLKSLEKCLRNTWFAFDFSALGSGKTYCGAYLSQNFDFILVVAPTSVCLKWKEIKDNFNIFENKEIHIITYAKLRQKNLSNKYLGYSFNRNEFFPTDYLLQIFKNKRVLFVCDEIQNIKNDTSQMKSVKEIMFLIRNSNDSKFLGISGSPVDKLEQVPRLLSTIHFMTEPLHYYNPTTAYYTFPGLLEVSEKLKYKIKETVTRKNHKEIFFDMFIKKFKPKYCFEMDYNENTNDSILEIKNAYYKIQDPIILEKAKNQVRILNKLYVIKIRNTMGSALIMSKITNVLMQLELLKKDTAIRVIKQEAENFKKLVLIFNYNETITSSFAELNQLFPGQVAIVNGSTSKENREIIIKNFQEPNENLRIIIGNTSVLSSGIDLDDKEGNFNRFCLVSPNFNIITMYQLTKRFKRANTKSNTTFRFLFCDGIEKELKILQALEKKGNVMSKVTNQQTLNGEKYITNLEDYYEIERPEKIKDIIVQQEVEELVPKIITLFHSCKEKAGSFQLPCNHYICQDCIQKSFSNGGFNCEECKSELIN